MKYKKRFYKVFIFLVFVGGIISFSFFYISNNFFKDNTEYDEYVFYSQAISLAIADVDKALNLCSKNNKTSIQDECFKEIVKIVSEKDLKKGLDICGRIENVIWRNECFFLVAETLFNKNISLAAEICEKSELFNRHCYIHLGQFISSFGSNPPFICNHFPIEFKDACFWGYGYAIIDCFESDINSGILACSKIPIENRGDCFRGLGERILGVFDNDIASSISACNKMPVGFRGYCFKGLGEGIGKEYGGDSGILVCKNIPIEYKKNDCLYLFLLLEKYVDKN